MRKGQKHTPEALARIKAARAAQDERQGPPVKLGTLSGPRTLKSRRKQAETVRAKWADPDYREARGKTVITYQGVHQRLFRLQGVKTCQADHVGFPACNQEAADWAIRHDVDGLLHDPKGRPYSMRVEDYVRLCRSHHGRYDGWGNKSIPTLRGEEHGRAKLTWAVVAELKHRHAQGETLSSLAREKGISVSQVWKVVHGKAWTTKKPVDE